MNQIKLLELVALSQIEGIGPQKLKYLIKVTQNCQSIWEIDQRTLEKIIGPKLIPDFLSAGQHFNAQEILGQIEQSKSEVIYIDDDTYPQALKEISDAPPILFVRGNIDLLNILPKKLAVVGSRKYSSYGRAVVESLIPNLVQSGLVIVSGLALGIDALAHEATVDSNGQTIAVLGSSLDLIYPRENFYLAKKILDKGGLLVSEFPPGTPPLKQHFPRRNRIIAGISDGVLVIEAALKSGSLITAQLALDYNREVMAIPGEIFKDTSKGVNKLIKEGAQLVSSPEDILSTLKVDMMGKEKISLRALSAQEELLLELLAGETLHIDQIAEKSSLPASESAQLISQLEIVGVVQSVGGGYYRKR